MWIHDLWICDSLFVCRYKHVWMYHDTAF
jgi:hypothetical protein